MSDIIGGKKSYILATLTQKNGTRLSEDDIKNICHDVQNGMSYRDIQNKYTIGGGRLARILKMCNVKSIVRGGWENMNPVDIHLNGTRENLNRNEYKLEKNSNYSDNYKNNSDPVDKLLNNQIENMKKSMESIKFKSFID